MEVRNERRGTPHGKIENNYLAEPPSEAGRKCRGIGTRGVNSTEANGILYQRVGTKNRYSNSTFENPKWRGEGVGEKRNPKNKWQREV